MDIDNEIRNLENEDLLRWVDRSDPAVDELATRFAFVLHQIAQLRAKYKAGTPIIATEGTPAGRGDARDPAPVGSAGA